MTLPAGNYTIESDRPLAFQGRAYQWTRTLDVVAGRETTFAFTAANAEVSTLEAAASSGAGPARPVDPEDALLPWQASVLGLWTPIAPASGAVVDARGLIVTSQRVLGPATTVEVQVTPAAKVAATVLVADAARDVAVLRVAPEAVAAVKPLPLGCGATPPPAPAIAVKQDVFAIGVRMRGTPRTMNGIVMRVQPGVVTADLDVGTGGAGGPAFSSTGAVMGITSIVNEDERKRGDDTRIPRLDAVCAVLTAAEAKLASTPAPSAAPLPVEPTRAVTEDDLQAAAKVRVGSLNPYVVSTAGFDIAFITPVVAFAGQAQASDFANWTAYVSDFPSVLLLRVTPKQAEAFWTRMARGVALTQGIALPAFLKFKPGFQRMRVTCGTTEVTPIHPLLIERRISEREAVYEGLYAFDPGAISASCGEVRLDVFSEKAPTLAETVTVPSSVLDRVWRDFASFRALK
ncbi:MAG: serine protease [Vicinamibacterales bacterium]